MQAECGFANVAGGATGSELLVAWGPTLKVNVGFDADYKPGSKEVPSGAGITGVEALVDTGASDCCIDSALAAQLRLPIMDRRNVSGVGGPQEVNMHLAQVYIPAMDVSVYGAFAGVHLLAGGQTHRVLLGRTFLQRFRMVYNGPTGSVVLTP
jgi:hypothetical protein